MDYERSGNTIIARVDSGESLSCSIEKIAKKENIKFAFISGIGAANHLDIGCYQFDKQEYRPYSLDGDFEITSVLGNITTKDGEFYLHLHITAADDNCKMYGGHFNDAIISGTCELNIQVLNTIVDRKLDEKTGINIFDFKFNFDTLKKVLFPKSKNKEK